MSEKLKSVVFAIITCLICSLLLTAASSGLKDIKMKNIIADRQKNILKSVGLIDELKSYSHDEISSLYSKNITRFIVNENGRISPEENDLNKKLIIYIYKQSNEIESYIIPVNTRGLWGKIKGYLALKNDGSTISGFTVYQHSETPGLGGEIEKKWFQKNFQGKKIIDRNGDFVSITIAKKAEYGSMAKQKRVNHVDGISGATLTGNFLTSGLKETLLHYEPVSIKFRTKQMIHLPHNLSK